MEIFYDDAIFFLYLVMVEKIERITEKRQAMGECLSAREGEDGEESVR